MPVDTIFEVTLHLTKSKKWFNINFGHHVNLLGLGFIFMIT